jgi:hypothetical protein
MRINEHACLPKPAETHRNQSTTDAENWASNLLGLLLLGTLDLGGTTEGLLSVLALLACFQLSVIDLPTITVSADR